MSFCRFKKIERKVDIIIAKLKERKRGGLSSEGIQRLLAGIVAGCEAQQSSKGILRTNRDSAHCFDLRVNPNVFTGKLFNAFYVL